MCARVGVLYAGRLVEEGTVDEVLQDPRHPYTVGLLRCIPRGGVRKDHGRLDTIPGFLPALGEQLPGLRVRRPLRLAEDICRREEPPLHRSRQRRTSAAATSTSARRSCRASEAATLGARRGRPRRPSRSCASTTRQGLPAARAPDPRAGRRVGGGLARRDARARRRVGQRQDDARAHAARDHRADATAPSTLDGRDAEPAARATRRGGDPRPADRLPEPRLGAQPPPHGAPHPAAHAAEARRAVAAPRPSGGCSS